ncbi:MAG: hypothetical protein GC184_14750 [Rhizobiales bacterium]|nr:hypothetical protein [Hyphomicrobiales bacterium]
MTDVATLEEMAAHLEVMNTQIALLTTQIRDQIKRNYRPGPLTVIVENIAHESGFTVQQLRGLQRHRPLTETRQMAMYLSTELTGYTQAQVSHFYWRDHTTVGYAIKRCREWQARRDARSARLAALRVMLEAKLVDVKVEPS